MAQPGVWEVSGYPDSANDTVYGFIVVHSARVLGPQGKWQGMLSKKSR